MDNLKFALPIFFLLTIFGRSSKYCKNPAMWQYGNVPRNNSAMVRQALHKIIRQGLAKNSAMVSLSNHCRIQRIYFIPNFYIKPIVPLSFTRKIWTYGVSLNSRNPKINSSGNLLLPIQTLF